MSGRWCAYLLMFWFAVYWEIPWEESAEDPMAVPRALGLIARSQKLSELARRVGVSRDGL